MAKQTKRLDKQRALKDKLIRGIVTMGGVSILAALLLIFVYLFSVISPIFQTKDASLQSTTNLELPAVAIAIGVDNTGENGFVFDELGHVHFFSNSADSILNQSSLSIAQSPILYSVSTNSNDWAAFIEPDGQVILAKVQFEDFYEQNKKITRPVLAEVEVPFTQLPSDILQKIKQFTFSYQDEVLELALFLKSGEVERRTLRHGETQNSQVSRSVLPIKEAKQILLSDDSRYVYVLTDNKVTILEREHSKLDIRQVIELQSSIVDIELLSGGQSLLILTTDGIVSQWFESSRQQKQLQSIRSFSVNDMSHQLLSFPTSKAFITVDNIGHLSGYWATSEKQHIGDTKINEHFSAVGFSENEKHLVSLAGNAISVLELANNHAEITWKSVFSKVWYEGYEEPQFVWQTTAANDEYEAKYSLTPLIFGTLKAAFYAMLFAVPIAILSAIYSAYFMSPKLRGWVKPTIELTETLPTVIIGFMAAAWLAPEIDKHLVGVFTSFISMIVATLLLSLAWFKLPTHLTKKLPNGWHLFVSAPILISVFYLSLAIAPSIENLWFNGDVQGFLNQRGFGYDQRNSLIVGIAMGFAVIPTIFTIAEDAIHSVPKHLTDGSLALGATEWQTLSRIVLLTASPGIFSAVMLGLGRAVGETMIVLMATGNTPIVDWNLFEGLRSLSATIAIETLESEVNSTHFRMLFLAAFILFIFTFFINSVAGYVRQRLQSKYRSL